MGVACSKSAYDDTLLDREHYHNNPYKRNYHHHHHHHGSSTAGASSSSSARSSGMARTDPALFALQEQSTALYNAASLRCSAEVDADASDSPANSPVVPIPATLPLTATTAAPVAANFCGQHHLLYKQQQKSARQYNRNNNNNNNAAQQAMLEESESSSTPLSEPYSSRLVVRRHPVKLPDEGTTGTHIYAVRWPVNRQLTLDGTTRTAARSAPQEQSPYNTTKSPLKKPDDTAPTAARAPPSVPVVEPPLDAAAVDALFHPSTLAKPPQHRMNDWVTVSEEHDIYVADVGLTAADCDRLVQVTEHVCRGQYAAYTYAKQTLGCREFPALATAVHPAVHAAVHGILTTRGTSSRRGGSKKNNGPPQLALDDREPHMVKYDVTKKERQKLDMHTDKSEWTFLISLSTGCGLDFEGGGTYFEVLDATVHVQRGHALVFPGKLRHCGQRITSGLRFLLVGFLVDKSQQRDGGGIKSNNDDDDEDDDDQDDDFPNAMHLTNVP